MNSKKTFIGVLLILAVLLLGIGYVVILNITGTTPETDQSGQAGDELIAEQLQEGNHVDENNGSSGSEIGGTSSEIEKTTLASVMNENIGDYIDLGNNIVGTESTADDWRILYVEGDTVYAILADYLPNSTGYAASAGLDTEGLYVVYSSVDRDTLLTGLTTTSYWSGLADGIAGATVAGAPTGDLLMNSYNTKNGTSLVYNDPLDSPPLDSSAEDYDLYVPHSSVYENCYSYWLASPVESDDSRIWLLGFRSFNYYGFGSRYHAIRPVVSLPSDIECSYADGIWTIE